MKSYIIYDLSGKIITTGVCSDGKLDSKASEGRLVMEGIADGRTQKIVGGEIVSKTPKEIKADEPPDPGLGPTPFAQQRAVITNEQWQAILNRLTVLEEKI